MILIFSKSKLESSTEAVIDWIESKGYQWKRINGKDLETKPIEFVLSDDSEKIKIGNELIAPEEIKVVWFRRWQDGIPYKKLKAFSDEVSYEVKAHYRLERKKLRQFLFDCFEDADWLSFPDEGFHKFHALRKAKKAGLNIPSTFIVNNLQDLKEKSSQKETLVTKPISDAPVYFNGDNAYMFYTKEFSMEKVEIKNELFFPSLFQKKIDKVYELRVFYLDGKCYPMAIFSQLDKQTQVDFRVYNTNKPNRYVPYKLPNAIEEKIKKLMQDLNLETGSLDLIKSKEGAYIFLEVNPIGQFGMTSGPCNYHLEKKIAEYLISKTETQNETTRRAVS